MLVYVMKQLSSSEVAKVVEELQVLVGARINKIYQPDSHELLIRLYKKDEKFSLRMLSGKAVFLSSFTSENTDAPPAFCTKLRRLLDHAKVESIVQHATDRIIQITFNECSLIVELFGQGNFILVDSENNVLAVARKIEGNYSFPETAEVELKTITKNISSELDEEYSKSQEPIMKEPKAVKKLKNIIEKQEASAAENEKKSSDAQSKGDLIYLHYAEVKELLREKGLTKSVSLDGINLKLNLKKTAEQNAAIYYDDAKKFKKKSLGARMAAEDAKKKLENVVVPEKKVIAKKIVRKLEWFEKFHWFYTSKGHLAVGGRDAVSNEVLIKKYAEKTDLIFHTEMEGSPFFVLKSPQKNKEEIDEVATATVSYSRAWKNGFGSADAYWINLDQVKKEGGLKKGTFLIYSKKNLLPRIPLEVAIGFTDKVVGGPVSAIAKLCKNYVEIKPGSDKPGDLSKKIAKILNLGKEELDEIIRFLPAGKSSISKH